MTPLAAAPLIFALIILVIGLGARAPVFLRVSRRAKPEPIKTLAASAFLREQVAGRVDLSHIVSSDIRRSARRGAKAGFGGAKRVIDVAAALALLFICLPLMILTALAIKTDSRGPVLYRQRRIGLGGEAFEIFKFRSMIVNAEENGAQWAERNDHRVTRVGRLIRKAHIDEIPQALNVLRGEMSFVGPRPERPEFVEILETEIPNYHLRHLVKPGITGWAQIKYVYGASVEDARIKLQYDLYYIRHFSVLRDISIMFMTIRVALFGLGGR